jgi:hypothetical protein
MTSVTVQQIRHAKEIQEEKEQERQRAKQLKNVVDQTKQFEKQYKAEWMDWKRRPENKILVNGRLRMRTFKQFLEVTNKDDCIPLDESHPLWVPSRRGKPSFFIDAPVKYVP